MNQNYTTSLQSLSAHKLFERRQLANIEFSIAEPLNKIPAGTVLFMHGIGGDDTSFYHQSDVLSDQYRVIAWNMPGYRGSPAKGSLNFESLAQSLLRLIDVLKIEKLHLGGQSIGGMVAQEFYHRYPKRVRSLVLMATTSAFGGKNNSFRDAFLSTRLKPLDNGVSMAELAHQAIPAVTGRNISNESLTNAINAMASLSESIYRDVLKCLVTFNRRAEFASIACPVCLIAGTEDANAPASTMARMATRLECAEYHEIPDAGHLVNTECPDECNRIIRQFLSRQSLL